MIIKSKKYGVLYNYAIIYKYYCKFILTDAIKNRNIFKAISYNIEIKVKIQKFWEWPLDMINSLAAYTLSYIHKN